MFDGYQFTIVHAMSYPKWGLMFGRVEVDKPMMSPVSSNGR